MFDIMYFTETLSPKSYTPNTTVGDEFQLPKLSGNSSWSKSCYDKVEITIRLYMVLYTLVIRLL